MVPSEITKALEGLGSSVNEIAGIPKRSGGPKVRVDTDPEAAKSAEADRQLSSTHEEVQKAIAAAEGAARGTSADATTTPDVGGASVPPAPPDGVADVGEAPPAQ